MPLREINARINELLKQSIKSDGVIQPLLRRRGGVFAVRSEISRRDLPDEGEKLRRRTVAQADCRIGANLSTDQYGAGRKIPSEILSRAMSNYLKGLLTNEEVIQELLKIAHEIAHGKESDKALDLNDEELAFYDALTKPEAVRDFYTNEQLVAITRN